MNFAPVLSAQLPLLKDLITRDGFGVVPVVYGNTWISEVCALINTVDQNHPTFRKTADLFAIRQFLKALPEVTAKVFTAPLQQLIGQRTTNNARRRVIHIELSNATLPFELQWSEAVDPLYNKQ